MSFCEPDRVGYLVGLFTFIELRKEELSVREKSYWNQLPGLAYLILFVLIGCTQIRVSPPVVTMRQDMDNIVNTRGIPLNVTEGFVGGSVPRGSITLYYPDAVFRFQTDDSKSYTVLTNQQTISFGSSIP